MPAGERVTPREIVRTYLLISFLYTLCASLIWGVNTLFLLDAGLDIAEVFIANAAYTAGMVVFEIPTGVLADTRGRRASFLLSVIVLFVGTLAYVAAAMTEGGLATFVVASVVLGLGFTFYSGAFEAWLVDALRGTGYDAELDPIFARGQIVTGVAMVVGTIGGGILGDLDLSLPFMVRAALFVPVFAISLVAMHDIGFAPRRISTRELPFEMRSIAKAGIMHGLRVRPVRLMMLVAVFQYGFLTWAFYAWQPYFLDLLGRDSVWVAGVISSLVALSTIGANVIVDRLARLCGRRTTLLLWAAGVQALGAVGVGLATSLWIALPLFLVTVGTMGIVGPVKQSYIHLAIPSEQRATIVSLDSMLGNGGSVGGQIGLGYLARAESIALGYVVGGGVTAFAFPLITLVRRMGGRADVIVGRAGETGACAGTGLPAATAVDAVPRRPVEVEA